MCGYVVCMVCVLCESMLCVCYVCVNISSCVPCVYYVCVYVYKYLYVQCACVYACVSICICTCVCIEYMREREKKYFIKRETRKSRRVSKPLAKLDEDLMLQ